MPWGRCLLYAVFSREIVSHMAEGLYLICIFISYISPAARQKWKGTLWNCGKNSTARHNFRPYAWSILFPKSFSPHETKIYQQINPTSPLSLFMNYVWTQFFFSCYTKKCWCPNKNMSKKEVLHMGEFRRETYFPSPNHISQSSRMFMYCLL